MPARAGHVLGAPGLPSGHVPSLPPSCPVRPTSTDCHASFLTRWLPPGCGLQDTQQDPAAGQNGITATPHVPSLLGHRSADSLCSPRRVAARLHASGTVSASWVPGLAEGWWLPALPHLGRPVT